LGRASIPSELERVETPAQLTLGLPFQSKQILYTTYPVRPSVWDGPALPSSSRVRRALTSPSALLLVQEWLGYRNINSKRLASSPMKQPVSLTSASEGARQLSEKTARVEDDDHPAAHAGKGGAPTFAKAVKEE
jgi:hypothetical protein